MTNRRRFLLSATAAGLATLGSAASQIARAQAINDDDDATAGLPNVPGRGSQDSSRINVRPYLEIGNFVEDRDRVFMFFLYTCPFCAQYAQSLESWGKTIPKPMLFVPVPLMVDDPVALSAAAAYYVARSLVPDRMAEFEGFAYAAGQQHYPAPTPVDFPQILYRMGLQRTAVLAALHSPETRERLLRAAALARRYRVKVTPDFGVGGRFVTNANYTGGNYDTLVQLLNGLVSKVMSS
ncbi:thioredoxin domain-containing protein [Paraburkholderia fungorum]|uniref:Thioredoxin domain-containing protein n=1 Tax=Paraburkholderia fungorum TaxID=134537 RepID=A0AAP5UXI1_9BURK|nr:thioredoxin domain-containing protein [Paraburkholderia fungorum]MDT8840312.1 thioredoxin domain-containing protein [Paraburkholderia fungorum]